MVSTRSKSVLSADKNQEDTAATHGEVTSAAPTPRRSGRLRSSGTAATPTAAATAPRTSGRTRRLNVIQEEQEQQAEQERQEQEQLAQAPPSSAGRMRGRRGRAAASTPASPAAPAAGQAPAAPAADEAAAAPTAGGTGQLADQEEQQQQQRSNGEGKATGSAAQPLKAGAAVVDLLAEKMFAALEGAFDEQDGSSSDSESDRQQEGAAQRGAAAASPAETDASDSDSEGEGKRRAGDNLPRHLRWRPELTLPGMEQGTGQAAGAATAAAAGVPAAAVAVHAVGRGGDGLHVAPPDERELARAARKAAPDTAGRGWFDLPATQITEEVKQDLRMLRLRGALDPKAHYKKLDSTKFPKYFQMGTVVEGPTDYYSGRLTKKQRKRTLTEEVMADQELTQVRKKRYAKLQEEQQYWSKKKTGRKTANERKKKAHHRPKH